MIEMHSAGMSIKRKGLMAHKSLRLNGHEHYLAFDFNE